MKKSPVSFVLSGLLFLTFTSYCAGAFDATVIPTGAALNVRTTQTITADSTHNGKTFHAIVDDPIVDAHGRVLIPRGSSATLEAVNVERSSNLKGRDRITLKVLSLHVANRSYQVTTNRVELKGPSEGKRATRKILGGAGIGAAVGGLSGGGTGAAIGAAAGGTTGGIVAGSGKTHLVVAAETRLQFRLDAPVRIHS